MSETPKCDAAIAAAINLTCPRCGVGGGRHFLDCPTQTELNRAYNAYREVRKDRERWHGKFAIVVQENNALRKSNRALITEVANLKIQMQTSNRAYMSLQTQIAVESCKYEEENPNEPTP